MENLEFSDTLTNPAWYAVNVRSRHEFKVLERLTKAGLEAFLPVVERVSRWKDRKKLVTFPMFPGYLFVHIIRSNQNLRAVLNINGVVRFIGMTPGEPEPIPAYQIDSLKILVANKETFDPYPYLKEGQRVRIKKGPLAGVHGLLVERAGKHILILSVDLLQQGVSLKIDAADVEAI